jgi:TatD-related deoxyribonuclease
MEPSMPITDNHMHLDPVRGIGPREVAKQFSRSGGTHLIVVNKLLDDGSVVLRSRGDFRLAMGGFLDTVRDVAEEVVAAYPVVGPHPAQLVVLWEELGGERAVSLMREAIELSAELVESGKATALGEVGRPHFEVSPEIWRASNELMEYTFKLAADLGCAVQLHTETGTARQFEELGEMARGQGLDPGKVVKHHSPPLVRAGEETGVVPSILAREDDVTAALGQGSRFLMETDYMDDRSRPGAVLGPRTVPRITRRLIEGGRMSEEVGWLIHKANVEDTYGIDISI